MLKLTKTGIGLLTKQYRSVLRKCLAINVGIFALGLATIVMAPKIVEAGCSGLTSSSSTADIVACLTSGATEIGRDASTSGSWSNALGYAARAGNSFALALGTEAHADVYASVALGPYATTSGSYAFAQGWGSLASKEGSIAIGWGAFANAENAVALGTDSAVATNNTISVGHKNTDLKRDGTAYGSNLFRRIVNVAAGQNDNDVVILKQLNDALNYYYTKTEADARYAKLSGGNTFSGSQLFINASGVVTSVIGYDSDGGNIWVKNTEGKRTISLTNSGNDHDGNLYLNDRNSNKRILLEGNNSGGVIHLSNSSNVEKTTLSDSSFTLNGSAISATGIVANTIQNSTALITSGGVYDALNYYYTFRVDERAEVTDSASFFQKNFSTLQKVDLQSKNPTHLGAFTKCNEVCPRPLERFVSSLSQEQMLKNDASVDAGTSRHCLRQFGDVMADLLKNTAAKSLRIYEFMNEEVCHA